VTGIHNGSIHVIQRIASGRTDLVFDLIAQGQPATQTDVRGTSLIEWCAYYGDVSAIRFLLDHGERLSSLGEDLGLNAAAFHGHWRLCEFLLEHGADANRPLPDTGETPLHAAMCKANRPSTDLIVGLLVEHGAEPNVRTKPGVETGAFMRDCRTKAESPLHRAAAFASAEAIDLLLKAGAIIDARDMNGDTPLSWASWHLRPDGILRRLCHGEHSIHPGRNSTYDHGRGWGSMDLNLLGRPLKAEANVRLKPDATKP
jgi:ankyrin repeat protein